MFWADEIVNEIIEKRKPPFIVNDWWTPSGMAHAGHIRTLLSHYGVYRGLTLHNHAAKFDYGFDDMDPMDGLPPDLPPDFEQYMGLPLWKVPSPIEGHASLADYYASKYLEAMEDLGVNPGHPRTSQMYLDGKFNDAITIALDRADDIRQIYVEFGAKRPDDWYPFQPICEQCGKVGTTYTFGWDGGKVNYRCEPNMVKWAAGCGYEGKVSPYDGTGKLFWKVEWPAKWFIIKTTYETGGKDHFTKNGTRDYARRIANVIFDTEEPIAHPHEFFLIGGKKMASSKGLGMSANETVHLLPPMLMRYLIYHIQPKRQIEFSYEGDAIPKIFDDFDTALGKYHADPDSEIGRAIVYAHQSDEPLPKYVMRFSKMSFLIQMPHIEINKIAEQDKGEPLTQSESNELAKRASYARRWLDQYADESAKFTLQEKLPDVELSEEQVKFLSEINRQFAVIDWNGELVHSTLHEVKNNMELPPKTAFSAIYRIFLNRDDGPQAGWFLASLDKQFVLDRLQEAINKGANND